VVTAASAPPWEPMLDVAPLQAVTAREANASGAPPRSAARGRGDFTGVPTAAPCRSFPGGASAQDGAVQPLYGRGAVRSVYSASPPVRAFPGPTLGRQRDLMVERVFPGLPVCVAASAALVLAGCTSSGGSSSEGPIAFLPASQQFTTTDTTGDGGPDLTSTIAVRIASYTLTCGGSDQVPDGGLEIVVQVQSVDGGALGPGTYAAGENCGPSTPACIDGTYDGYYSSSSGTVTLTTVSSSAVTGTYDVQVTHSSQPLAGSFAASYCSL